MPSGDPLSNKLIATRLDIDEAAADSATWTGTESGALLTVTAYLEAGARYRASAEVAVGASAAGSPSAETSHVRIRLDDASGAQIALRQVYLPTGSSVGFGVNVSGEYVATTTGNKTFVVTGQRSGGSNTHLLRATGNRTSLFVLDRIIDS